MAVIEFKEYHVNKMLFNYKSKKDRHDLKKIAVSPIFNVNIEDLNESQTAIQLSMELGSDSPFDLSVTVEGVFEYHKEDDKSSFGKEHILSNNAVAILFPYLRSTVSILTNLTNNLPPLNLPTMNIVEMMEKQNHKPDDQQNN